ncbi:GNAT family N-acetyltransferase [Serratia marcescens]|nr:GNAT family N-acetyltransferase [Serratia marcescens]
MTVVRLPESLDRKSFRSASAAIDNYFQRQVSQDCRRRITTCYVALNSTGDIVGFYTLAAASVMLTSVPAKQQKKLPRYPAIPVIRLGRLAVDLRYSGQGIGGALLADALIRAANVDIGAYALTVDAKDPQAANFYLHHGFIPLNDAPLQLFYPLSGIPQS